MPCNRAPTGARPLPCPRWGVEPRADRAAGPYGDTGRHPVGGSHNLASPKIVAGWPKVSQGGATMTGRELWEEDTFGEPVIKVRITGLAPGEVVALSGTGRYDFGLFCGPLPSGCKDIYTGEPSCLPAYWRPAEGRIAIAEHATADASGTARATLRFVMPETKEACPVTGGNPGWLQVPNSWKVKVTDKAHGLRLAPEEYLYGP